MNFSSRAFSEKSIAFDTGLTGFAYSLTIPSAVLTSLDAGRFLFLLALFATDFARSLEAGAINWRGDGDRRLDPPKLPAIIRY